MQKFLKYLTHPISLSAVLALFVSFFFLQDLFEKYEIEIEDRVSLEFENRERSRTFFYDLNNDGISERIETFGSADSFHSVQVYSADGGIVDQWNFHGVPPPKNSRRVEFSDVDNNMLDEIYLLSHDGDTVKLSCLEPFNKDNPVIFEGLKVEILTRQYAEPDFKITDFQVMDFTGDGYDDLILAISSGFSLIPRKIYCYDIINDSLFCTPNYGASPGSYKMCDIDNDDRHEIVGGTVAAGNVHDTTGIPFSDYSAWIMAYDNNLKLLFEPIGFPGFRSEVNVIPINQGSEKILAAFYHHIGPKENYPKLMLINPQGEIIDSLNFPKSPKLQQSLFLTKHNGKEILNVLDEEGKILQFDTDLKKINEIHLNIEVSVDGVSLLDLNLDGSDEIVIPTQRPIGIIITDHSLQNAVHKQLVPGFDIYSCSMMTSLEGKQLLHIGGKDYYYLLDYRFNSMYPFQYLIYFLIFLSFYAFIWGIRKLQLVQIEKKNMIRNQIANLQLKNINNQMDPHFTFNVFNTIASIIQKEAPSAYKPFTKFSSLIRNTLLSSDQIVRSIKDEVSYIESYLALEKLRFPNLFDYSVHISHEVDTNMKIPKMILQTYVENAIKHGIRPMNKKGSIVIEFNHNQKKLQIIIKDNGIGRERAKQLHTGNTGFGLMIMEDYFNLFNEYNEAKISHKIVDLYDEMGAAHGTKILILIPLNFSYKIGRYAKTIANSRNY